MSTTARSKAPFASTLPGRYYYDPAIYDQEQTDIFGKMWVYVGQADALPEPGAYQVVTVGQESIIVVRNRDGILQAFLNVCRHRGARLCNQLSGQLKGSIQCRYHAWTYGLDGRLIGAPNVLHELEFDRSAYGLLPVPLKVWEGLIWLSLADEPPSFESQINDPAVWAFAGTAPLARYDIGSLKVGKTLTYDVHANWKLVLENTLECYHCGPMHPELCDLLPAFRASFIDFVDSFQPLGPELTRVTCDWLFDAEVMAKDDFDPMDAVEVLHLVNLQDWEVCEMVQKSMASRAFEHGGIYVPVEQHIRGLADYILEKLGH